MDKGIRGGKRGILGEAKQESSSELVGRSTPIGSIKSLPKTQTLGIEVVAEIA